MKRANRTTVWCDAEDAARLAELAGQAGVPGRVMLKAMLEACASAASAEDVSNAARAIFVQETSEAVKRRASKLRRIEAVSN